MRIDIGDATIDEDGSLYLYNGEPFTGELSETHPNGTLVSLIPVRDGRVSGVERLWYPDGTPRLESTVFNGLAVGTSHEWHPNGQLAEERKFDDHGNQLSRLRWDQDGKPIPVRRRRAST